MFESKNKLKELKIEEFSHDASIFKIIPKETFSSNDFDIIKEMIKNEENFSVRAAGTCMSGGSLTSESVIRIDPIKDLKINKNNPNLLEKNIWVPSNIYIKDLLKELSMSDTFFAPYTSSKDVCMLSGMLGNNSSGEKSLTYGPTSKNISELKVILNTKELLGEVYHAKETEMQHENGTDLYEYKFEKEIITLIKDNLDLINENKPHTNKNVAGYNIWNIYNSEKNTFNLTPLFIGAQGTLGVITEAKIIIEKCLKNSNMLIVPLEHIHDLPKVVKSCVESGATSVECFDHETYELAKIHMKSDAKIANLANNKKIIIFAEFCSDNKLEINKKIKKLKEKLSFKNVNSYVAESKEESDAYWNIRRASFRLLKDFAPTGYKAIPIIEDTIVSLEHYDNYLKELLEILYKYDMRYTYAGHIGDGSIRLIPLIKKDQLGAEENILNMADEVYKLVRKYNGSMSCDHNDGLARTYALELQYDEKIIHIFKEIKSILDFNNILNPGKKITHSKDYNNKAEAREYALKHIFLN
jgi:FAD/FMN-containing dehydrogenase